MQFHLDGFRTGDPDWAEAAPIIDRGDKVDVLIVGCGPAGLTLAAQLAAFPDISTRVVEQKPGPLQLGQADGVACRTMEMFQAFGFRERVEREAYWVNQTAFWKPDGAAISRQGVVQDVEDGLSPYPHVILNQARVHEFYLDLMRRSPRRLTPDYARRLAGLEIAAEGDHPVAARLERLDDGHEGEIETVRARYIVGCDGARSAVRQALGLVLRGDSANQAWGVMDVLAVTDFPDIRKKCVIQSAEGGIVLIPREGGYLVRIYVEMDKLAADERVSSRAITVDDLIGAAQRILRPHAFAVKEVAWWSVYEIGQRLADRFDDGAPTPRAFIAGDACHTHSPKAGQGMNVSMQDAFNLGWKLAAVLRGRSAPSLLATYSAERQAIAKELIEFDREWAAMLTAPQTSPAELQAYFVRQGRYTAGTVTCYAPSILTAATPHQRLAEGFLVGARLHSAPVLRWADAKAMELGETIAADGRWRLFAFADPGASPRLRVLCDFLENSLLRRYTPAGAEIDSVIDLRAVFQAPPEPSMPALLWPAKGRLGLRDYEKAFIADVESGRDLFDLRAIDRQRGALVVVRPDQHVAHVLPLDAFDELAAYFAGFLLPAA